VQQWQESIEHAKVETIRYDTVSTTTTTTSTRTSTNMKRENSIDMGNRYTSSTYEVPVSSDITDFEKSTMRYMFTVSTNRLDTTTSPHIISSKRSVPTAKTTKSIREIVRSFWAPITTRKPRVSRYTVRSTRYDTTSVSTSTVTPFPTYYCLTRTTRVPRVSTSSTGSTISYNKLSSTGKSTTVSTNRDTSTTTRISSQLSTLSTVKDYGNNDFVLQDATIDAKPLLVNSSRQEVNVTEYNDTTLNLVIGAVFAGKRHVELK
jgi:hypothetical protein